MADWLAHNLWAVWLVTALVLASAELLTLDLTLLMLASGALAGALTALIFPGLWPVQTAAAVLVAFGMLFLLRPTLLRRVRNMEGYRNSVDLAVGKEAVALERITRTAGEIKLNGELWTARSSGEPIETGTEVVVQALDGITAIVRPRHQTQA